jgi:transposase
MLSLPPSVKIYLGAAPADMRKSFNGLSQLAQLVFDKDPYSGHLFVFFNKRRDQVRILFWDRNGFSLLAKRLEKGCFKLPHVDVGQTHVDIESAELSLILEGIDLNHARKRARWEPKKTAA